MSLVSGDKGVIFVAKENGDLAWYKYEGNGESDRSGTTGWDPNSGNLIGNGWQGLQIISGGNGVIFVVKENGDLAWYKYEGNGEIDPSAATGWNPNSGNLIGNGWQGLQLTSGGNEVIFVIEENGDLAWYKYEGNGESDRSGTTGWNPNSGNLIGNGWQGSLFISGGNGVIFAVKENGDLAWYKYEGNGEIDPSAATGWNPNSGNFIGNGWQGIRFIGNSDGVVFVVKENGDLAWYKYEGNGESDRSGTTGWDPNSGNLIGNGWKGSLTIEIRVPTLGKSSEATVGQWFKKAGDPVRANEPLVELETDKATVEVSAPGAGVMSELAAQTNQTVAIGALLGRII